MPRSSSDYFQLEQYKQIITPKELSVITSKIECVVDRMTDWYPISPYVSHFNMCFNLGIAVTEMGRLRVIPSADQNSRVLNRFASVAALTVRHIRLLLDITNSKIAPPNEADKGHYVQKITPRELTKVITDIEVEVQRAVEIYPFWPVSYEESYCVLAEEMGEGIKEILDIVQKDGTIKKAVKEYIQTAAMIVRHIKFLDDLQKGKVM